MRSCNINITVPIYNITVMSYLAQGRLKSPASRLFYSAVHSGADQRKHQSSALLTFVRGIHRSPVNSPHKGPVTRKMFPIDDVIMIHAIWQAHNWVINNFLLNITDMSSVYISNSPHISGIILGMGSDNDRRSFNVTSSFIGRAHNHNDPCT